MCKSQITTFMLCKHQSCHVWHCSTYLHQPCFARWLSRLPFASAIGISIPCDTSQEEEVRLQLCHACRSEHDCSSVAPCECQDCIDYLWSLSHSGTTPVTRPSTCNNGGFPHGWPLCHSQGEATLRPAAYDTNAEMFAAEQNLHSSDSRRRGDTDSSTSSQHLREELHSMRQRLAYDYERLLCIQPLLNPRIDSGGDEYLREEKNAQDQELTGLPEEDLTGSPVASQRERRGAVDFGRGRNLGSS